MRKATLILASMALVLVVASAAYAAVINGNDGPNLLIGTEKGDEINGRGGIDDLFGKQGNDRLNGGPGKDYMKGGNGNDILNGADGASRPSEADEFNCGAGYDTILLDNKDHNGHSYGPKCENRQTVKGK